LILDSGCWMLDTGYQKEFKQGGSATRSYLGGGNYIVSRPIEITEPEIKEIKLCHFNYLPYYPAGLENPAYRSSV